MKRIPLIAFLLVTAALPATAPIRIDVGPGKDVTVTIPNVQKDDIANIVSTFFGKGDEKQAAEFRRILKESPNLTLVITSK